MISIAYPSIDLYAEFDEDNVFSLIIENPDMFVEIISDINRGLEYDDGKLVVSENYSPISFHKHVGFLSTFVPFDINKKELITKLYNEISKISVDGTHYQETMEWFVNAQKYLYDITSDMEQSLIITPPEDIKSLLKSFDVRFNDSNMSLPEKVIDYMLISRKYLGTKVFITSNLRSYINDKQVEQMFYEVCLNKLTLICIENKEYQKARNEKRLIIDNDYCII